MINDARILPFLCALIAAACLLAKAAAGQPPESAGRKVFCDFEDINNNTFKSSGSGFAARSAGINQITDGADGKAVQLDGKSWLTITNFPGGRGFTIAAWIRTAGTNAQYIISKGNNVSGSFYLRLEMSGVPRVGFLPLDDYTVGLNARHAINDSQWHHVAATLDRHALSIYVDGLLENQAEFNLNITAVLPVYQCHAYIGGFNSREDDGEPDGSFFTGAIDEFQLLDSSASREQINEWAKGI